MIGDIAGLAFFAFATFISGLAALEHPTLLAWLAVAHNGVLTGIFAVRRPAVRTDRLGLWLGLIAAALPLVSYPKDIPLWLLIPGLAGYALTLVALLALGKSFGIAPADRGLVRQGPYRLVRHPMYLGELAYRCVLVGASLSAGNLALLLALIIVQVARIQREERIFSDYEQYAQQTRWRLLPGIW
jgi:protein-S-isoprenylcysteine O-methyltransferase Ste14